MNMEEKIKRINELYHKQKSVGLSEDEKNEQAALRQDYIAAIRGSIRGQLDNMDIIEKDGTRVNLKEKYKEKHT